MKALLTFVASLFCVVGVNAASPSFSSFFPNHFLTNNLIIKANLNPTQFDTNASTVTITITNVSGVGGLLWTNDTSIGSSGRLMPVPGLDYAYVYPSNFYNHGWFTLQPEFHLLGSGTNTIGVEESSHLMFSMTNDPTEVIITLEAGFAMGQELLLMSYTNTVFNGRFTLPADSVVSGGGFVKLNNNEDWLGENGAAIRLIWIEPDWWEQGRWTAGSNVTADVIWANVAGVIQPRGGQITNALQFISGSADAATNTLLTLDTVNVWTTDNSKLLDLRSVGTNVAYVTPSGSFESGRNVLWGFPSRDDILVGVHDASLGESSYAVIYTAAIDGNTETNYSDFGVTLNTGASPAAVLTIAAVTNTGVGSFNILLQPDQNVARIELMNNGTNTFTVADDSHYSNPGVLFLSNDGTYKVGGSDGTNTSVMQLGPFTPLYLPVANGTNTLTDSPVHLPSTGNTNIIVDGSIWFAGTTNVLSRSANNLKYANGGTDTFFVIEKTGSGASGKIGMSTGDHLNLIGGVGSDIYFGVNNNGSGDYVMWTPAFSAVVGNTKDLGSSGFEWQDVFMRGTNVVRGFYSGGGADISELTIQHTGNAGEIQYRSAAIGTGTFRPHVFMVGSTNVAKFDTTSAATETRFWIYDEDNGTMERVTVGAPDSGGVGFKLLRIPN